MSGPMVGLTLGASLPVHDWQFWVASVLAIGALYVVLNMLGVVALVRKLIGKPAKPKGRRVQLTTSARGIAKIGTKKTPEA